MFMGKSEKIALGIFIVSLVGILVLAIIGLQQKSVTGFAVENTNIDAQASTGETGCTDSDGKNYALSGLVSLCNTDGDCVKIQDSCSQNRVLEQYCENNEAKKEEYNCEFGCESGACVNKVTRIAYVSAGSSSSDTITTTTGTSATATGNVHDLGELAPEKTIEIFKNDKVKFDVSNKSYLMVLLDSSPMEITLSISGVPQPIVITTGETKQIDLTADNIADISIRVRSVNVISNKVTLLLTDL